MAERLSERLSQSERPLQSKVGIEDCLYHMINTHQLGHDDGGQGYMDAVLAARTSLAQQHSPRADSYAA